MQSAKSSGDARISLAGFAPALSITARKLNFVYAFLSVGSDTASTWHNAQSGKWVGMRMAHLPSDTLKLERESISLRGRRIGSEAPARG